MDSPVTTWHVLVVEDNPKDAQIIETTLRGLGNLAIHVVENAVQARDFLQGRGAFAAEKPPDLILLDLFLPIFDATHVLELVKSTPALKGIPTVVLTVADCESERERCLASKADAFYGKPVDPSEWTGLLHGIASSWLPGGSPR